MYNIIPLIIILVCLALILAIVLKKFPYLATFDVSKNPQEKAAMVKEQIINERLKRKVKYIWSKISPFFTLIGNVSQRKIKSWQEKLATAEEKYKNKPAKSALVTKEEFTGLQNNLDNLLEEAETLGTKEEFEQAEKKFIEIISLDPKNIEAFRGLGNLYLIMKNYSEARQTFEYILKLNKVDDQAYANLGKIEAAQGNLEQAREDLLKSIDLADLAVHHFELAEVCVRQDDYEAAKINLEQALQLEPNNPKYLDLFIKICIITKDRAAAEIALNKLKEVNPDNAKIGDWQEEINAL